MPARRRDTPPPQRARAAFTTVDQPIGENSDEEGDARGEHRIKPAKPRPQPTDRPKNNKGGDAAQDHERRATGDAGGLEQFFHRMTPNNQTAPLLNDQ